MNFNIEGLLACDLKEIQDERGSVLHMIKNNSVGYHGFGECYFSEILPGFVKAWKKHTVQTQNFAVPVGRIKLVVYDDRINSISNGLIDIIELGRPNNYLRVVIPPNLWYGFSCIGDKPALLANCANFPHNPSESLTINYQENNIPYNWI